MNPGQAHLKLLDYRTREGVKYYQRTTAALYKESHFDVEADQLNDFLKMLEEHAKDFGWIDDDIGGILNIPIDLENILERDFKNVVTNLVNVLSRKSASGKKRISTELLVAPRTPICCTSVSCL